MTHPLEYTITEWQSRAPYYDTLRAYAQGRHQLKFATPDFQQKYGAQLASLRENLCEPAYTAFTDRLTIESWGSPEADTLMAEKGVGRLVGLINDEAFRCGDAYVLVWPDRNQNPVAHYHRADQLVPYTDPLDPTQLAWAGKPWVDENRYGRVNIYDPQQVTRWITKEALPEKSSVQNVPATLSAWKPYEHDGDPATIPHHYGTVPACWWPQSADTIGGYGRSILTDVIPLQDGLNKTLADTLILGEAYSRPFRYLLNYQPKNTSPIGAASEYVQAIRDVAVSQTRRFDPTRQQIFAHDGAGPIGQLDIPDINKLLDTQNSYAMKIARVVGIPPFYITQTSGDVPSGESLRVLAARMIARVRRYQRDTEPVYRGLAQLLGVENVHITWADPMPLDEMERWERARIQKSLGYPLADILHSLNIADAEEIAARAAAQTAVDREAMGKALRDGHIGY